VTLVLKVSYVKLVVSTADLLSRDVSLLLLDLSLPKGTQLAILANMLVA
jgi:hypothetical protein